MELIEKIKLDENGKSYGVAASGFAEGFTLDPIAYEHNIAIAIIDTDGKPYHINTKLITKSADSITSLDALLSNMAPDVEYMASGYWHSFVPQYDFNIITNIKKYNGTLQIHRLNTELVFEATPNQYCLNFLSSNVTIDMRWIQALEIVDHVSAI